ncbi:hypothetical protein F5Y02DRAFT_429962 [Annulohypoxylon stygium]|nr:hypothetical protein F5Y02DRAFT_429962 [Annulohypoxylon stygium]
MRLACVGDNGEVIAINDAIEQEPLYLRFSLLDSLFTCFESLPDSPDFFLAEYSIRKALLSFQDTGNQERYTRNYILTRSLDPRIEKTPRADLLRLSFQHGGPIALVGILFATSDAHRNIRSRETLEYLLNRASDGIRLALIRRAGTFPCSPSLVGWLSRILDKLEPDVQGLACILWWLGAPYVPAQLLNRARLPSLSWGVNGETIAAIPRMLSLISDETKTAAAVQSLEYVGFLKSTENSIELDKTVATLLQERLQSGMWLPKAAKIILHALPKYLSAGTRRYTQQCKELLAHTARVFSHLHNQQMTILVEQMDPIEIVEACLSVSHFNDRAWKIHALSIASMALATVKDATQKPFLEAMVDTRRYFLSVLFPDLDTKQGDEIKFPISNPRSNAFSANLAIALARKSIQVNQLGSARRYLEDFNPFAYGSPSTLENEQNRQIALMRARILRFEGYFQEAYHILQTLPPDGAGVRLLLSTVLCELGRYQEAIELLEGRIAAVGNPRNVPRTQLALAHAYLFKCMYESFQGRSLDRLSLEISDNIYKDLVRLWPTETYFERMDYLSMIMGIAIIQHMSSQVQAALKAWKRALATSIEWLSTGYTDLIISYSMNELEIRREDHVLADTLASHTRMLLSKIGRQHHFLGLGSVWPNIIGKWLLNNGQSPIL